MSAGTAFPSSLLEPLVRRRVRILQQQQLQLPVHFQRCLVDSSEVQFGVTAIFLVIVTEQYYERRANVISIYDYFRVYRIYNDTLKVK